MESSAKTIPASLIYEMVNGQPIYYRGYRAFLEGNKPLHDIIGSSKLQAFLIAELIFLLKMQFGKQFFIFTNELGIQFSKKNWRAVDIAVVE
ncbi:MAG: Uma2 family endonuclease, partial [Bacteroidota bacterium]